jgi:hypothetical protein
VEDGQVLVTFSSAAAARYRQIAGRTVGVDCVAIEWADPTGAPISSVRKTARLIVPRRRSRLIARFPGPPAPRQPDYCTVDHVSPRASSSEIAAVPLTPRGAAYLDGKRTVADVLEVLALAEPDQHGVPPSASRLARLSEGHVVPVSASGQAHWTDGRTELSVGESTRFGSVYFYDAHVDTGVVTSNMLAWIGVADSWW